MATLQCPDCGTPNSTEGYEEGQEFGCEGCGRPLEVPRAVGDPVKPRAPETEAAEASAEATEAEAPEAAAVAEPEPAPVGAEAPVEPAPSATAGLVDAGDEAPLLVGFDMDEQQPLSHEARAAMGPAEPEQAAPQEPLQFADDIDYSVAVPTLVGGPLTGFEAYRPAAPAPGAAVQPEPAYAYEQPEASFPEVAAAPEPAAPVDEVPPIPQYLEPSEPAAWDAPAVEAEAPPAPAPVPEFELSPEPAPVVPEPAAAPDGRVTFGPPPEATGPVELVEAERSLIEEASPKRKSGKGSTIFLIVLVLLTAGATYYAYTKGWLDELLGK